ncbi:MAG: rod shape-determining protein MreC [Gammaproteobacteria bacterium]|nr:rod shape-determining protein MreC [Gammaproteobacteria bacterium]MDE0365813.1 rod shape-determining protein MreC [Gammaproteobacteria bacterium]
MKALFLRRSGAGYLLLGLVAASLGLVYLDTNTRTLEPARDVLGSVVYPGQVAVESPYWFAAAAIEAVSSRASLLARLDELELQNLELTRVAMRLQALSTENDRMRELLGSRARLPTEVMIAELVGVVPNPDTLQVIIDKGTQDGVRIGQAVIDAEGLFGQVVETSRFSSWVLQIADVSHAVPVELMRNGLRSIAGGTGQIDLLLLENVPVTADIRQGDLLLTSGLGGRFPRGYPVGQVQSVLTERTRAFAQVSVKPSALLDRSSYLLVVLSAPVHE